MLKPPPELLMQTANDPSVESFFNSFPHVRAAVSDYLGRAGYRFGQFPRVLDFGCGVGRFLFAMREVLEPGQSLFGCDIDSRCAGWCSANIDFAEVALSQLDPPLPYEDGTFDLVYALSVFTHLSLRMQFAWAWELSRILKPGGVLFVSTHGLMFMKEIMAIRDNWGRADIALFGANAVLGVFAESSNRAIEGQREVAVFHTVDAVQQVFSGLRLKYHDPISYMAGGQSISILEKPYGSGRPIFPEGTSALTEVVDKLTGDQDRSGVKKFRFSPVSKSAVLRFYLTFDHARRDCSRFQVQCRIATLASGATVYDGTFPIPVNATAGNNHFLPFAMPVSALDAHFEVELRLRYCPGHAATGETVPFKWSFPRIEA